MDVEAGSPTMAAPAASAAHARRSRRGIRRAVGGAATFLLGGLTTLEVLTIAVGYVAAMAFLWMSGATPPERLVTGPGFRAVWVMVALLLLRPVTWLPYLAAFLGLRRLSDLSLPRSSVPLRNLVANLLTVGVLAGAVWLTASLVPGAGTAMLSAIAFATGSGSVATLGTFRGDWTAARVVAAVAAVLVGRLFLPPLGRDLDVSEEPVLGVPEGARGVFDRVAMLVVLAGAVIASALGAYLLARR